MIKFFRFSVLEFPSMLNFSNSSYTTIVCGVEFEFEEHKKTGSLYLILHKSRIIRYVVGKCSISSKNMMLIFVSVCKHGTG